MDQHSDLIQQPTIILGVIGSDCHAVGNKILEAFFSQKGFRVINLGVMVSQDEFIDAALETDAKAILVSSLYGHGEIDCDGFRNRCIERGLETIILYAGGNLVIGKHPSSYIQELYRSMGFNRVFGPDADLEEAATLLHQDIQAQVSGERVGQTV